MKIEKPDVLSKDEKLACSLVDGKHSYRELKVAIDEACIHQRDDTYQKMLDAIEPLIQQARELEEIFELRHKADIRAITMWREKHPERELTLPDHADMVIWLLERLDKFEDTLKREIEQNLPKALEIEQAKAEVAREIFEEIEKLEYIDKEEIKRIVNFVWDLDMMTGIEIDEKQHLETAVIEGMKAQLAKTKSDLREVME